MPSTQPPANLAAPLESSRSDSSLVASAPAASSSAGASSAAAFPTASRFAPAAVHSQPPASATTPAALSDCETDLNRQLGSRIAWKALACGLVADGFAWQQGVGLNLAVYLSLILLAAASVLRLRFGTVPKASSRLLGLGAVFSFLLILRDAEELQFLNFLAGLSCLALAVAAASPSPLGVYTARVRDVVASAIRSGINTAVATFPLLFQVASQTRSSKRSGLLHVVRVVALSVAVTGAFGALLAAGDPVFRNATQWLVRWSPNTLASHAVFVALFAWPVAGLLWGNTALSRTSRLAGSVTYPTASLRPVDVVTALTALNVLFGAFVATQARVLFGGQAYVLATTGLSLADYARSGFFTLIVVAGLVLSLLLAFNALLDKPGLSASKSMQRLSYAFLSLTGVVLVSAAARMIVYTNTFGASPDRVFALTIIGGLALVMMWFAITVLRNRPVHFAFGALAIGWSTLLAFNVANPHALVARNHLARAARGELSDMQLVASHLSADVVPLVVAAAEREMRAVQAMPIQATPVQATSVPSTVTSATATSSRTSACGALAPIAARLSAATAEHPWSTWNFARWRAARALAASSGRLAVCR